VNKVKPTLFENALYKIGLPGTAATLYHRRLEFMAATGAYEGTRSGNRPYNNFLQFITGPNSRVSSLELQTLRNQSRFLNMTGIGSAYSNRLTDLAIGRGLNFRAGVDAEFLGLGVEEAKRKNQEFTRLWKLFWHAENGTADRMYPGGYFQAINFKSMLDGGDSIALPVKTKPRFSHPFPFALKAYEAEVVSTPYGRTNDSSIVDGFQRNDDGVPYKMYVAEHINKYGQVDAEYKNASNWTEFNIFNQAGIRQVFHCKNLTQDRPGAIRGIPFLTPASGMIIDHNEFADAVVKAAKAQAVFAVKATGGKGGKKMGGAPGDNQTAGTTSSFPRIDWTGGQIVDLPEGFDLTPFESTHPRSEFTGYQMHSLAVQSAITGIARSFILMLFDKSYSASKGETSLTWVTVLRHRYTYVYQFLFPFWEYLLSWAVASGNISAPGFFNDPEIKMAWLGDPIHQFTGPRMPQLDLQKEAAGLKTMIDAGIKSRRGVIEETSTDDPDQVFAEIQEEQEMDIFNGIVNQVADNATETDDEDDREEDE
jgi:capsid protein